METFEKTDSDVKRALASVTVFRAQMKIFEKKFNTDRQYDDRLDSTNNLMGKADKHFTRP